MSVVRTAVKAEARAEFRDGFRFNTRIYLNGVPQDEEESICVGAVAGLNPGSFEEGGGLDPTMRAVANAFNRGFERLGLKPPEGCFVRIFNLFYLCCKDSGRASAAVEANPEILRTIDGAEAERVPFIWLAWGGRGARLPKDRFLTRSEPACWVSRGKVRTSGVLQTGENPHHPLYLRCVLRDSMIEEMLRRCVLEAGILDGWQA